MGWSLYVLPMELRPFFKANPIVLFWFGIIPNFGCAFALPTIVLKDKSLTYGEAKRKLIIFSFYTFCLLLVYELLETIKGFGTFDLFDLAMSMIGITVLNLIFRNFKIYFEPIFKQ